MKHKGYYDKSEILKEYELVVLGGGVAGICAAIAAARKGTRTALIQDRSVLGGNASSELRGCISGASCGGKLPNAREEGIVGEIVEKDSRLDPDRKGIHTSMIMWEICKKEKKLSLYFNTCVYEIEMADKRNVVAVRAIQLSTEKRFKFKAKQFVDASGDGIVAAASGASFRMGSEARDEFDEPLAPEKANDFTMGATLMFQSENTGHPIPFKRPEWAYNYPDDNSLPFRLDFATGIRKNGFWWIEYGGMVDSVHDTNEIREELLKCLYGVWDHLKNTPGHNMENYQLIWVGLIPAKREGRRFIGDHILTENDIRKMTPFKDAVAYGGWNIDIHNPEGFKGKEPPNCHAMLDWIYSIPLRCLYSKDLDNLWLAGRTISVSKIAFASTRLMGTLGICGEAVGYAASIAIKKNKTCSQTAKDDFKIIQQEIFKNGGYIPWKRNEDSWDLALSAKVSASSQAICELTSGNESLLMDRARGIMFPVTENRLDTLEILVKNSGKSEAILSAKLKQANYPGDFYQKKTISTSRAVAKPGTSWVKFEFSCKVEPGLYWIAVNAVKNIHWIASSNVPVGVYSGEQNKEKLARLVPIHQPERQKSNWITDSDVSEGVLDNGGFMCPNPGKKKTGWDRNSIWQSANAQQIKKLPCPCFKVIPESSAYPPDSVINGINRPEIFPNLWISNPSQSLPQHILLKWDKNKSFNTICLIFDNDIDAFRPPISPRPVTVKDYQIEVLVDGCWKNVVSVRENIERRRVHRFNTVNSSELKVVVNATWGAPEARIYEIRVYLEK